MRNGGNVKWEWLSRVQFVHRWRISLFPSVVIWSPCLLDTDYSPRHSYLTRWVMVSLHILNYLTLWDMVLVPTTSGYRLLTTALLSHQVGQVGHGNTTALTLSSCETWSWSLRPVDTDSSPRRQVGYGLALTFFSLSMSHGSVPLFRNDWPFCNFVFCVVFFVCVFLCVEEICVSIIWMFMKFLPS